MCLCQTHEGSHLQAQYQRSSIFCFTQSSCEWHQVVDSELAAECQEVMLVNSILWRVYVCPLAPPSGFDWSLAAWRLLLVLIAWVQRSVLWSEINRLGRCFMPKGQRDIQGKTINKHAGGEDQVVMSPNNHKMELCSHPWIHELRQWITCNNKLIF